jgi:hypothetical protein
MALYSLYLCCKGTVLSSLLLVPFLSLRTGILYAFQRWTVALPLLAGLLLLLLLLLALSAFLHLPSAALSSGARGPVLSPAWPRDQLPDPQALFLSAEFLVICSDYILCLFSRLLHFALGLGMPSSGYQSYLYRHLHSYLHSHLQRHLHVCSFCLCWQFWQGLPRTISVWLPCCGDWWVVLLQTSLCVHIAGWRCLFSRLLHFALGLGMPSSGYHSYLYRHLHSYLHIYLHICSFCLCWQFWQGLPRTISVWLPCCGDWWVVLLQTSLCVHIAGWRCLFSRLLHFALGLGMPSSGYHSYLYRHLHSYLHIYLHICSFCLCWQFWQGLPRTISVWLPCCGDWWVVLLQTSLCVHIAGWRSLSLSQCFPGSPTPSSPMHSVESSLRLPPRFPLLLLWCSSCLS